MMVMIATMMAIMLFCGASEQRKFMRCQTPALTAPMVMNLMDEHAISMVTASTPRIDLTSARTYLKVRERGSRIFKSQAWVFCTVNLQKYLHPVINKYSTPYTTSSWPEGKTLKHWLHVHLFPSTDYKLCSSRPPATIFMELHLHQHYTSHG
jgi:hypothetical protein